MAATQRFIDLIHYVCNACDDPASLGATKLNKIAWFADTLSYRLNGSSISGEEYVKRQFGPVPRNALSALDLLEKEGKIIRREPRAQFQPREFVSIQQPDPTAFSDQERNLLDTVIQLVCGHTATSISGISHDQIWDAAQMGEKIPLYAVLAAEPGEITEDDLTWGTEITDEISTTRAA